MFQYILKRVLAMIPTLIGISFITFFIILAAPGDPVATQMGADGGPGADSGGGGNDSPEQQADTIKAKKKLLGILEEVHGVLAFDGAEVASARGRESDDEYRKVPDFPEGEGLGDWDKWAYSLANVRGGSRLLAGAGDGNLHLIDATEDLAVWSAKVHEARVFSVAVSADGATFVSGDSDGLIVVGKVSDGAVAAKGEPIGLPITDLEFLPGGKQFVSACRDGVIRVHETADASVVRTLEGHVNFVAAVAVSADGTRCWSAGADRMVREWKLADGSVTRELGEATGSVNALDLSKDESLLVTGSAARDVQVWSTAPPDSEKKPIATLEGHFAGVTAVTFLPDDRTVVSGAADEELRSWDVEEARCTSRVRRKVGGRISEIVVSEDGAQVWAVGETWRKTPVYKQYWTWVSSIAVGDFGRSFIDKEPVIDKLIEGLKVTVYLNLIAFAIIYVIGIPIGIMSAVKRGSVFDMATSVVVFLLWSIPSFWLATMLIMYFSSKSTMDLVPSVGLHAVTSEDMSYLTWLKDWGAHLVLPMIVLVYNGFAGLSQYARTAMLETIGQDYVRTARAKGLSEQVVIFKHALRNSLIVIITLFGSMLPAMIGGSVIVEYIFNIQGMGLLGYEAILQRDYPVIMAVVTSGAILTLLGILVSDLLYVVADPRISHK